MTELALTRYFKASNAYPRLSLDQELALFRSWKSGNSRARAELLCANLRYVIQLAIKLRRYGIPVDDLIGVGNEGLIRALEKFEPRRGLKFVTYSSWWIRCYMYAEIFRQWSMVNRTNGFRRGRFFKLRRELSRSFTILGEGSEAMRLTSERTGIPPKQLDEQIQYLKRSDISVETPAHEGRNGETIGDRFTAEDSTSLETLMEREHSVKTKALMAVALSALEPRELRIVKARLMADDEDVLSLAELGRQMGVSRERIRQLEARAIVKLRQQLAAQGCRHAS